jgi:hypothetical protein
MTGEEVDTLASAPALGTSSEHKGSLARDVLAVFFRPRSLFQELPRTNRVASALILLMALYALYGLGMYATGVLNYEIDVQTQTQLSGLRQHPPAKDDAAKFTSALETIEKGSVFQKELSRVALLAGGPIQLCLSVSVLSAVVFLVVALRGGKPNFQVLLGVTTFAAYVEVPRLIMQLVLTAQLHVSRVETSAAAFFSRADIGLGNYLLVRRLDPFEVWYYVLVGLGLYHTGQLKRRWAIVTACLLALFAAVLRCMGDLPQFAEFGTISFGNS